MIAFGDDNVVNVNEEKLPDCNQINVTKAFATFGYKYTDESKQDALVGFKDLSDCSFLKRRFDYDPRHRRFIAPLELNSILEAPMWTKNNIDPDEVYATLEAQFRELSLHDESTFATYSPIFISECRKHYSKFFRYTDRERVRISTFLEQSYY